MKSFYKIADVPQNKINVIGAKTSSLRLSMETLIKNILHHKELNIENYKKINNYIKTADYVLQESKNSIIFYKKDKILYKISIKTTKNKKENFLTSFHISNEKQLKKDLKRYKQINGQFDYEDSKYPSVAHSFGFEIYRIKLSILIITHFQTFSIPM